MGNKNNTLNDEQIESVWLGFIGDQYRKFVEDRWPKPNPVRDEAKPEDNAFWEKTTKEDYERWLRSSFMDLIRKTDTWIIPYHTNMKLNRTNYPSDHAKLRYPVNAGYSEIVQKDMKDLLINTFKKFIWGKEKDKSSIDWNLFHSKYAFVKQIDLSNFVDNKIKPDDVEIMKTRWNGLFERSFPFPEDLLPEFGENVTTYNTKKENSKKAYTMWKEEYWKKFYGRIKQLPFDTNPIPYTKESEAKTLSEASFGLWFGKRRGKFLQERVIQNIPFSVIWNDMFYTITVDRIDAFKLWEEALNGMDAIDPYKTSKNVILLIKPRTQSNIKWQWTVSARNDTWGIGGSMGGLNYKSTWPYPFTGSLTNNYGEFINLPPPMNMTDPFYFRLPDSEQLNTPPPEILKYWFDLMNLFKQKNPRGVLPFETDKIHEMLNKMESDKKVDRWTNRVYQSYLTSTKFDYNFYRAKNGDQGNFTQGDRYDTSQMKIALDEKFKIIYDQWNQKNLELVLNSIGIYSTNTLGIEIKDQRYPEWRDAIIQSIHLRLALRHYDYPAEKWMDNHTYGKSNFPSDSTAKQMIVDKGWKESIEKFWKYCIWSDNWVDQKQNGVTRPFGAYEANAMSFPNIQYLLYLVKRSGWSADSPLQVNKLKHDQIDLKKEFCQMIYHQGTNSGEFDPQTEYYGAFFGNVFNLHCYSPPNYWDSALSFFIREFYHALVIENQLVITSKDSPSCSINPTNLRSECIEEAKEEEDFRQDGASWKTPEGKMTILWLALRKQWDLSKALTKWPTWYYNHEFKVWTVEVTDDIKEISPWNKMIKWLVGIFQNSPGPDSEKFYNSKDDSKITGMFIPVDKSFTNEMKEVIGFVSRYSLPIQKSSPPVILGPTAWNEIVTAQWQAYKEWVMKNVAYRMEWFKETKKNKLPFIEPMDILKDEDGNTILDPRTNLPSLNNYPDFGALSYVDKNDIGWMFSIGGWTEYMIGNVTTTLNYILGIMADGLKMAFKVLKEVVSDVLGDWLYPVAIGAAILGSSIVYKNLTSK
jgi:hypothetical protein